MSSFDTVIRENTFTANGNINHPSFKSHSIGLKAVEECSSVPNSSDSMAKVNGESIEENPADIKDYKLQIVWKNVILQILLHSSFLLEYWYLRNHPDRWASHWSLLKFSEYQYSSSNAS